MKLKLKNSILILTYKIFIVFPISVAIAGESDHFQRFFSPSFRRIAPVFQPVSSQAVSPPASPAARPVSQPPSGASRPATPSPREADGAGDVFEEGLSAYRSGDYQRAAAQFEGLLGAGTGSQEAAFNLGLARYKLGEYDAARKAFDLATLSQDMDLAGEALYGKALCDHVEALNKTAENPKAALDKTQQALRKYHDVLTLNPNYAPARDGRQKAANLWAAVKEALEQQPQQQGDSGENDNSSNDNNDQDQQNQSQDSQSSDNSSDSSQNSNQNADSQNANADQQPQSQQSRQGDAQNDNGNEPEEQKAQPVEQQQEEDSSNSNDNTSAAKAQADSSEPKQQDVTREQALRQLRQLMDRQRLNERNRRPWEPPEAQRPVEKDW